MSLRLTEGPLGICFMVRVVPRSGVDRITGTHNEALRVRLAAPPVGGAANRSLVRFLAKHLGVRPRQVEILSGHASRQKRVRVNGLDLRELRAGLVPEPPDPSAQSRSNPTQVR